MKRIIRNIIIAIALLLTILTLSACESNYYHLTLKYTPDPCNEYLRYDIVIDNNVYEFVHTEDIIDTDTNTRRITFIFDIKSDIK